jgi:hypothetical protein
MEVVATYLRLGTKYQMEEFRTQAVKRLSYEFPATLEELDHMKTYSRIDECASYADEHFTVINLARSYNLPRVLPWAFAAACELLSVEEILRQTDSAQPYLLREDQQTCLVGWQKLLRKQRVTTFSWLTAGNPGCSKMSCKMARHTVLIDELLPSGNVVPFKPECHPLAEWEEEWEKGLCASCVTVGRDKHRCGRQKLWDALPSMFGLPEWAELTKP